MHALLPGDDHVCKHMQPLLGAVFVFLVLLLCCDHYSSHSSNLEFTHPHGVTSTHPGFRTLPATSNSSVNKSLLIPSCPRVRRLAGRGRDSQEEIQGPGRWVWRSYLGSCSYPSPLITSGEADRGVCAGARHIACIATRTENMKEVGG